MEDEIWVLPLVLFAAGIVYAGCWKSFDYADHLLWVFLSALLLIILVGIVLHWCCDRKTAFWGALFLSGYNCAVYGLQIYLSQHIFGFGLKFLPYTDPMTLPIYIFKIPLYCFLYDILPEPIGAPLAYCLWWVLCFVPLVYVPVCKKRENGSPFANCKRNDKRPPWEE